MDPQHRTRRPDTRAIDDEIKVPSYSEFRRLKRLRLAELDQTYAFWPRSPSPEDEPLLRDGSAEQDGTERNGECTNGHAAAAAPRRNPALEAATQEELSLFMCAPAAHRFVGGKANCVTLALAKSYTCTDLQPGLVICIADALAACTRWL